MGGDAEKFGELFAKAEIRGFCVEETEPLPG